MKKAPQLPRRQQLRDHQFLPLIRIEPLQPTHQPSSLKKLPTATVTDRTRSAPPTTATIESTCNKTSRTPPISIAVCLRIHTRTIRKIATSILTTRKGARTRDTVDTVGEITQEAADLAITSLTLATKVEATTNLALPTNGRTSTTQMAPTQATLEAASTSQVATTIQTLAAAITITSIIVEATIRRVAIRIIYLMHQLTLVGTDMNTMIRVTQHQLVEAKALQATSLSLSTTIRRRTRRRANRHHREQARVRGHPLARATTAIAISSNMITIMVTMPMISLRATIT